MHVSRLRTKLRTAGVDGLVETLPSGAYRLASAEPRKALPLEHDLALDGYVRLREEQVTA